MGIFEGLPQPASEMLFQYNDDKDIRLSTEEDMLTSSVFFFVKNQVAEEGGAENSPQDPRNLSSPFFHYPGRHGPQPTLQASPILRKSQRTRQPAPPRGPTDHDYAFL